MEPPSPPDLPEPATATRLTASTSSSSSLFPLFPVSSNPTSASLPAASSYAPEWLTNSSFTADVSAIHSSVRDIPPAESDDEEQGLQSPKDRKKFDLVHSPAASQSGSGSESDREADGRRGGRKERRRKKKKKRKRREDGAGSRKSGVHAWDGSGRKPSKDYYFDAKGDLDNLEFGSLYRMDVARYKLHSTSDPSGSNFKFFYRTKPSLHLGEDSDLDFLDSKVRSGGRYFSVKFTSLQRNKGFKHIKISQKDVPFVVPEEFIPLEPDEGDGGGSSEEVEESWEDEVIKKTREFNRRSREYPHDEKVWLSFAQFQDKIAKSQPQKSARLQTLEKKISILEKAVELNPDSEDLLICLLSSYKDRDTTETLLARWERTLMQHSDSVKLWKEYLRVRQSEFSRFKVSDVCQIYGYAVRALSSACYKFSRQDARIGDQAQPNSLLVQTELGLVDIFVNLCRFEWQTGHKELATGLLQSQVEYGLFSPILDLTPSSKKRLFEHFWNSSGARVGEDGALGWSSWLSKDEERQRNVYMQENSQEEEETGKWSGWFDPHPEDNETKTELNGEKTSIAEENDEDALDDDGNNQTQEDVETLLKKLGIDVHSESHSEVKDAKVWYKWSEEEVSRDCKQWMPVREKNDAGQEEGDELSRVILFEDVTDYLFSLSSKEAQFSLICQFIDFFGGKVSQWCCTNDSSWLDKILSLEAISGEIFEDLRLINNSTELMSILGCKGDFTRDLTMLKFLKNSIVLCLEVFPRNHILENSLLILEELLSTVNNSSFDLVNPSRALAKSLLKKDRQDFLLCGIYAQTEAAHGNVDLARKIFDMALLSIEGSPKDFQEKAPLLHLWYAELEIAHNSDPSTQRALHILSCLGSNAKYTPFASPVPRPQILRAHQGFKEQIKSLWPQWACGDVKESDVALVCSASLFEIIMSGYYSGLGVIEEAFSMVLPERRSNSLELERLWEYYIRLIIRHMKQLSMSRVWKSVSQGLHIYPFNPKSFTAMVSIGGFYSVSSKVRLIFDKCAQRNPSMVVWLFAISFEWGRDRSHNRIRGLFEKALTDIKLQKSVLLWRWYIAYEVEINCNPGAARRVFFRAIHACPWSKSLWLDGFQRLSSILTLKELADLEEVMRDKELHIHTDIYEILLQDEMEA